MTPAQAFDHLLDLKRSWPIADKPVYNHRVEHELSVTGEESWTHVEGPCHLVCDPHYSMFVVNEEGRTKWSDRAGWWLPPNLQLSRRDIPLVCDCSKCQAYRDRGAPEVF